MRLTPKQRNEIIGMIHESFARGYERGHHDGMVESGKTPIKQKSAPWTDADVCGRVDDILGEEK